MSENNSNVLVFLIFFCEERISADGIIKELLLGPKYANGYTLHCIVEIRAHWVETKPFEIDNPRHHYPIVDNAAFVCIHVTKVKILHMYL